MKCELCKWWEILPASRQPFKERENIIMGECHRNAPSPVAELILASCKWEKLDGELTLDSDIPLTDMWAKWPLTDNLEWCGNFEPK